mmetsp:Transcript_10286/g.21792  ORF Transcript_10286/g.21792 Transcript_10286/m.21792 type:complete len:466 (-) Transcript_10286:69-1466(-)|eukprot:CAMPEP_0180625090 /NCGR_PEP_ID=MMETSP1037_2-20121125/37131_1 /TAXON_ID=632150 /ORGANISM="Azadinium spinosum, Strain 3D9" /LENGTH=465 /DNA_ID=CAMNT_0022645579 /DNA_START=45 /DNA_END=1442 /DNA_ORIENTATION=+
MASWFGQGQDYAQMAQDRSRAAIEKAHARYAREGGVAGLGNQLSGYVKERVDLEGLQEAGFSAVGADLQRRKAQAFDGLFMMSGPVRTKMLLAIREMVKEAAVADPEMWGCVRRRIEHTVDMLWTDLLIYQEKVMLDTVNTRAGRAAGDHDGLAALGAMPRFLSPLWFRAQVLYHYLPFDHSIFGQLKDPIFILFTIISMIVIYGVRILFFLVILIFIVRGCPPDEYQLVGYILMFKGTQVISSGVIMSIVAVAKYYMCVHPLSVHTCATVGPGADSDLFSAFVDFIGSSVLVWCAFLCLPCSTRSAGLRQLNVDPEEVMSDDEGQASSRRCCRWDTGRGGRLSGLLFWDLFSFLLSCAFLFGLCYIDVTHARPGGEPSEPRQVNSVGDVEDTMLEDLGTWEFRSALFLTRVFYAFLSMPFLVFMLPVLNNVLTHTTATGYNPQGFCVPFVLRPMPRQAPQRAAE